MADAGNGAERVEDEHGTSYCVRKQGILKRERDRAYDKYTEVAGRSPH